MASNLSFVPKLPRPQIVVMGLAGVAFVWAFLPVFEDLADNWAKNPLYSHGYLIPVFAVVLLWLRRGYVPSLPLQPSLWGLVFLLFGSLMYLGAAYFYYSWPGRASFIPVLAGATLIFGGWAALRWTWPSLLFLVFVIPLPGIAETYLLRPMQRLATLASTNVLQTLGIFAQADGNVIVLSEVEMGVVEACSGLRMLSVFVALSVALTLVMHRPLWQKLVIVLSAFPIAVLCNVVRISVTGVLHQLANKQVAEFVFHDVAGWLMMPLALMILWLELKVLHALVIMEPSPARERPLVPVS